MMQKAIIDISNVSKVYGSGINQSQVLKNINLKINEGEFVAILGFSGSGKTTLISLLAGLLQPDSGEILFKGKRVTGPAPDRGVIFQSYSLLPWLSVKDNVALAVNAVFKKWTSAQRDAHIEKYIHMVGLSHAIDRKPAELSGGMRQRVSVARALAMSPDVLLMDEPLSALDALTRANLQDEIETIWEQEKKTVVLITNDVDEALLLADRVIPLNPGPGATLGPEFEVHLDRPRERTSINTNKEFVRLRSKITDYLLSVGEKNNQAQQGNLIQLPKVLPNTHTDFLPDAIQKKNENKILDEGRYVEFFKTTKIYPTPKGPLTVVDEFNLNIKKGEFVSLIGHSGCGKSTLLSMAAGLNEISGGGIVLDGKEVTTAGPDRGVVFQSPSLFPWLTAFENVSLGVDRVYPHVSRQERRDIVEYYLTRVGLSDSIQKRASDLSNGMKQRVGIARAFALSPKLLLLDEPFGMLDSLTRWDLQEVLMEVWERTHVTAICVTHDVDEAILLADRVVMMTNGPNAKLGKVMSVDLPRPRSRKRLLEHPDYYELRRELLTFLSDHDLHHQAQKKNISEQKKGKKEKTAEKNEKPGIEAA